MDYKKLAKFLNLCGNFPDALSCIRECDYFHDGEKNECITKMTEDAANAITELLERAEKAERERNAAIEDLKEISDCNYCDGGCNWPALESCEECNEKDCRCRTCDGKVNWKWRGAKMDGE